MRRLTLSPCQTQELLKLPETGMGYQRVKITLKSGRVLKNIIVENSMYIQVTDEIPEFDSDNIKLIELETNSMDIPE